MKILNCSAIKEAERNIVFAARLTQRGHEIKSMNDLVTLYEKPFSENTINSLCDLPHPTIQKFAVITVAVVGASRRFLSQITRHQNEVKFMSASLQYSDYGNQAEFAIPYEIMIASSEIKKLYLESCKSDMDCYIKLCNADVGHDAAGYATPQGLRNVLLISATLYQWKHMIGQRTCRRNTDETRIVFLKIWQELYILSPTLFTPVHTGPFCQREKCAEGKMSCKKAIEKTHTPSDILFADYPMVMTGGVL